MFCVGFFKYKSCKAINYFVQYLIYCVVLSKTAEALISFYCLFLNVAL